MIRRESGVSPLSLFLLITICGCGGPGGLPVNGVVQFDDGEPIRVGVVEFRSLDGNFHASSKISDTGTFALETLEGDSEIPLATYDVIVSQIVMADQISLLEHNHGRLVARSYGDYYTSGLRVDVTEETAANMVIVVSE